MICLGLTLTLIASSLVVGCGNSNAKSSVVSSDGTHIDLSNDGITVNGTRVLEESINGVFLSNDIVYYEDGKDDAYGAGTDRDAHDIDEANGHTVVNITEAGDYILTGSLESGQIAINLGEDA